MRRVISYPMRCGCHLDMKPDDGCRLRTASAASIDSTDTDSGWHLEQEFPTRVRRQMFTARGIRNVCGWHPMAPPPLLSSSCAAKIRQADGRDHLQILIDVARRVSS